MNWVTNVGVSACCAIMLATASGCASGRKMEYRGAARVATDYKVETPVLLGVVDRRAEIADKGANWVGVQRSLAGIPYRVETASGRPLATDVGEVLTASLAKRGFAVKQVVLPSGSGDRAAEKLMKPDQGHGILVVLRKWETQVYFKTTLYYDVGAEVIDSGGSLVAESSLAGEEVLASPSNEQPGRLSAPATMASIFGNLLKTSKIRTALLGEIPTEPTAVPAVATVPTATMTVQAAAVAPSAAPEAVAPPAPEPAVAPQAVQAQKCTVDQVMKMKDLKFTDAQIKAACE